MPELTLMFKNGCTLGLRPVIGNPRNKQAFVQCVGMYPEEGVLRSTKVFDTLDIAVLGPMAFPYPQVFMLRECTVACGPTTIWEQRNGVWVKQLDGLLPGLTWSVADFHDYLLAVNGVQKVRRDPATKQWLVDLSTDTPVGNAVLNLHGQAVWAAPNFKNDGGEGL